MISNKLGFLIHIDGPFLLTRAYLMSLAGDHDCAIEDLFTPVNC